MDAGTSIDEETIQPLACLTCLCCRPERDETPPLPLLNPSPPLDRINDWKRHDHIIRVARINHKRVKDAQGGRLSRSKQSVEPCVSIDAQNPSQLIFQNVTDSMNVGTALTYKFDACFDGSHDTSDIFERLRHVYQGMLYGHCITTLVDGFSGSGKSYTLLKGRDALVVQAMRFVFDARSERDRSNSCRLVVQAIEFYKNGSKDALKDFSWSSKALGEQINSLRASGHARSQSESRPQRRTSDELKGSTSLRTSSQTRHVGDRRGHLEVFKPYRKVYLKSDDDLAKFCKMLDGNRERSKTVANTESSRSSLMVRIFEEDQTQGSFCFIDICGEEDMAANLGNEQVRAQYRHINTERAAVKKFLIAKGSPKEEALRNQLDDCELTRMMGKALLNEHTKLILISHLLRDAFHPNEWILKLGVEVGRSECSTGPPTDVTSEVLADDLDEEVNNSVHLTNEDTAVSLTE